MKSLIRKLPRSYCTPWQENVHNNDNCYCIVYILFMPTRFSFSLQLLEAILWDFLILWSRVKFTPQLTTFSITLDITTPPVGISVHIISNLISTFTRVLLWYISNIVVSTSLFANSKILFPNSQFRRHLTQTKRLCQMSQMQTFDMKYSLVFSWMSGIGLYGWHVRLLCHKLEILIVLDVILQL